MDSPARNPSPPPELRDHAELLEAERIGNTAFSKHWLFTTLMKLIEEVDRENEEGTTDLMVDVDEELQNELCKLWDMSMNSDVSKFLEEFQAVDILTGIIDKSKAPRVTEICVGILGNMACEQSVCKSMSEKQKLIPKYLFVGILGNMACEQSVCKSMSEKQKLIEIVLLLLESRDPPTLVETTRLIYSSVSNTGTRGPWINAIRRSEEVLGHLLFIFQSSTNCDLLKNTAELVDVLLDLEPDLCVSWATDDFIQALLEATEQIGGHHYDTLEVYLHIFQSFSTTEPGVEALVAHLDYLVKKLMKFLNVVCEYEIVGVDKMEGPLTSALSVLNILFTTQIVNKDRHSIQNLCKDEKLMRILLKILEPLYPLLQKYNDEFTDSYPSFTGSESHMTSVDQSETSVQSHVTSADQSQNASEGHVLTADQSVTDSENRMPSNQSETNSTAHVTFANQSESANELKLPNGKTETDEVNKSDLEEFKQLKILYDILSGLLIDYCTYLFRDEPKLQIATDSQEPHCRDTETKGDHSCVREKGDNSEETKEEDNSEETKEGDNSEETHKGDNSETSDSGLEMEKTDDSKEEEIAIDSQDERNMNGLPVLTYLDESCSRCRINYFTLTLKNRKDQNGSDLLKKIYEHAKQFDKERLIRIFNDVHAGRVVKRAESSKFLEDEHT